MKVTVRLLRPFSDAAGRTSVELEMPSGSSAAELVVRLCEIYPSLRPHMYEPSGGVTEYLTMFFNDRPVLDMGTALVEGAEVLMMFPVSGG